MLMINRKELNQIESKYYYQEKLFTGASFRVKGEKIEELLSFEKGICIGPYTNKYFPSEKEIPHLDIDYIDFAGEYLDDHVLYKNKRFSGVAYELEKKQKICLGIHLIIEGMMRASLTWYISGAIKYIELIEEDLMQSWGWRKNGTMLGFDIYPKSRTKGTKDKRIMVGKEERIKFGMDQKKQLKGVWIEENYFEWIEKNKDRLEFDYYIETRNSFDQFLTSEKLRLSCLGVDDRVFNSIGSNNGFKNLEEIVIFLTSISEEKMLELVKVKTLKNITFRNEKRDLLAIAKEFKQKRPDCLVTLNDKEIRLSEL